MRLRSSITSAVEAPPPEKILALTERQPDSFDFLALPEEIRMCVYRFCLVSDNEISFDDCLNIYYVLNDAFNKPSVNPVIRWQITAASPAPPVAPTVKVIVPANFIYPAATNSAVEYLPSATPDVSLSTSTGRQVIPAANVIQPANLRQLPTMIVSAKIGFPSSGGGIYIGPVYSHNFPYLPACDYVPPMPFNTQILQTCKTVYIEALPVLYCKNSFVIHTSFPNDHFFMRFTGVPVTLLAHLRLEVADIRQMFHGGGSTGIWSTIIRQCTGLRKVVLSVRKSDYLPSDAFCELLIQMAANIAGVKKGTGEPVMTVRVKVAAKSPDADVIDWGTIPLNGVRAALAKKTHPKIQLPRGFVVELMGTTCADHLTLVQAYTKKQWRFRRKTAENGRDIEEGTWVELEWVKSEE